MNRILLLIIFTLTITFFGFSQENYKTVSAVDSTKTYSGGEFYPVKHYKESNLNKKPKNIIFMIGDGMGLAHVYAGMAANGNHLFLENLTHLGFSRTQSSNRWITDSAAGGTALSSGQKTYNGAIGVDTDTVPIVNIREIAEKKGKATGVVSTSAITHATPASFVAHQPQRVMYEEIAGDFLNTNIDVFIGGGYKHFTDRKDGKNLVDSLKSKGYLVLQNMEEIAKINKGKLAGLCAPEHSARTAVRGDMLQVATKTALNILDNDMDGFFVMIEGSQIDWGAHQNDIRYVVEEMLDFDRAIGAALEFAAKDKNTLIIVTADHETGGLSLIGDDISKGIVHAAFTSGDHTGVCVPVFAFGPGAENFTGFMENTEIANKLKAYFK